VAVVLAPAAAYLIERLVVTDREAVTTLIEAAAGAVANRDFVALKDALDEEYSAEGRDRDEAARYVEAQVVRHEPTAIGVNVRDVAVNGDVATARVGLNARAGVYRQRIEVEVRLRRRPEGWRITSAVPTFR
jgi:hypothetical protein